MADPFRNFRRKWHLMTGTAMYCFEAVHIHVLQSTQGTAETAFLKEAALAVKGLFPVKVLREAVLCWRATP
ncbi:hypothetical protein K3728_16995 [Rhodobacteraceae bacterium M385]|nr:hypothetical protein K3728_16995 [Rhodobacteraceae bacterium M385]